MKISLLEFVPKPYLLLDSLVIALTPLVCYQLDEIGTISYRIIEDFCHPEDVVKDQFSIYIRNICWRTMELNFYNRFIKSLSIRDEDEIRYYCSGDSLLLFRGLLYYDCKENINFFTKATV